MQAIGSEWQGGGGAHSADDQWTVEMGKQIAAARQFPFQSRAKVVGDDRQEDNVSFPGTVFASAFHHLPGG